MSLTFKVYREDYDETRRFRIDENLCTNFSYVKQKIEAVFQISINSTVKIRWKDEEDMVTLSSDEELVDAIGNRKDEILKLFISVQSSDGGDASQHSTFSSDESAHQQRIHQGIFCNGCSTGIDGNRFKCIICPDYDLCTACFMSNKHPVHDMLVVRDPNSLPHQLLTLFTLRMGEVYQRFQTKKARQQKKSEGGGGEKKAKKEKQGWHEGAGADWQYPGMPWPRCSPFGGGHNDTGTSSPGAGPPPMWGPPPGWHRGRGGRGGGCRGMWGPRGGGGIFGNFNMPPWMFFGADGNSPIVVDSDEDNITEESREADASTKTAQTDQPRTSPSPMVIDPATSGPQNTSTPEAPPQADDKQPSPQPTAVPENIASSLEMMKSMGFTDDNNWLSHLLVENNGDINATLTAIQRLANSSS